MLRLQLVQGGLGAQPPFGVRGAAPPQDPDTHGEFVLINKSTISAKLLNYALSVKNNFTSNLLTDPQYAFGENPNVIKLSKNLFEECVKAYTKKLRQARAQSVAFFQGFWVKASVTFARRSQRHRTI